MEINTSFSGGRLTIFLSGELDHHEARRAGRSIDELLDEYLPRECALNLAELSFMDSSGIAVIMRTNRRVSAINGRMWIEDPSEQPRRVLDTACIYRVVPVAISR